MINSDTSYPEDLIYEEGEGFWSDIGRKKKCRVIHRSTSGITSDIRVQEFDGINWIDIPKGDPKERELFEDCIYFATMSFESPYAYHEDRDVPKVKGYNLGP